MSIRRLVWWFAAVAGAFLTTAAAAVALDGSRTPSPSPSRSLFVASSASSTKVVMSKSSPRGRRGRRGRRGPTGVRGSAGIVGDTGAPGTDGRPGRSERPVHQVLTINWQNGNNQGRDRATFGIPGIGSGEIACTPDTQWVRVFPADQGADTVMWTMKAQTLDNGETETIVRTARHEQFTGPDFHEGLNRYNGEQRSSGSIEGLISTRGARTAAGGPTVAPTSFRMTWHWTFDDSFGARCYVAARFVTGPA